MCVFPYSKKGRQVEQLHNDAAGNITNILTLNTCATSDEIRTLMNVEVIDLHAVQVQRDALRTPRDGGKESA